MKAVASRAEWYGQPATAGMVETHDAFGWKVHRHCLPVGARMLIVASRPVTRASAPNKALFVQGRATVTGADGTHYPDRVPGLWTDERPDQPAGVTTITATEDLEFWCFNYTANRRAFPVLEPVRLDPGATLTLHAGQCLFLAAGALGAAVGPCSITTDTDIVLTAGAKAYGFLVEPKA